MAVSKTKPEVTKYIKDAIIALKKYYRINKVILFGSQLTGKVHRYSDIDLAIVSPDFEKEKIQSLIDNFANVSLNSNPRVELHSFTTLDLRNARPTNFLGFILKTGKLVYSNNRFIF